MIQPGVYDITIQRRADYTVLLQFKDSEEVAINLSSHRPAGQIDCYFF